MIDTRTLMSINCDALGAFEDVLADNLRENQTFYTKNGLSSDKVPQKRPILDHNPENWT